MSAEVEFGEVLRGIEQFGRRATVITINETQTPHVVTSLVDIGDDHLLVDVGTRTRENLLRNPALTLLWYPEPGHDYQLILDAVATDIGEPNSREVATVAVTVHHGIQHRLAGLWQPGPSCQAIDAPAKEPLDAD